MKLVVILSRFPYPLEKGDKLRAFHQIKELSKNDEIYLFCLTDQEVKASDKRVVEEYCRELHILNLNKLGIYWNAGLNLFSDKPFQVGYFYSKKWVKFVEQEIRRIEPDHIYAQLIRTSEYVKNIHDIPKTIDYMDALGQGMIRRFKISGGLRRQFFKSEGQRLLRYEHRIFDYFDHHTIISKQDRGLISHPKNNEISIIENGISESFFEPNDCVKEYDLVFVGNMNYAPNIECAQFIVNDILPELTSAKLLLSGANPSKEIKELERKNVVVSGWVDDIRDSYGSGKIFVAPLFIGTGLQNKLLEAMAMGLPCITTTLANNALGATPNENILIANSKDEFKTAINQLLTDQELYKKISISGQNYVQENFSWANSVSKLRELFTC
ncbi:MAG: glycosyltransferase [Crocinitomicaceae bacterium]|nr:glycosyltransferase [Crocinitomicaceae bacterium]